MSVALLAVAALIEAATGAALVAAPSTVTFLLLDDVPSGTGLTVGRVAGIALLALAAGSWVGRREPGRNAALASMLTYNILAAIYLAYVGVQGAQVGKLLWPAVAVHAILGLLLTRSWFSGQPRSLRG